MTLLVLSTGMVMAQTYTYPVKGQKGFSLSEKTRDGMHINYQLGQFTLNQMDYRGEAMSEISISGIVLPNTAGSPNLPTESRMIAIPNGAKATLNVVHYDTEVFHNVNIAPALRIQNENEEPDMEYKKDTKVYSRNAYYPENPFMVGKSYIRGVDAVTVAITPFQYNPVTKDLVVYTNIELSLSFQGGNGQFGDDRLRSPYWDPILAAELMNYDQLPVIDYEARMQQWLRDGADGAEYLIITPNNDAWAPYAQQLKEFRTKQGILTEVYRLDEMPATTTNAMKEWFHNAYHNWDIAPVAVCLLGDHGTNMGQYIPAETVSHPNYGSCISDNQYADAEGNDLLPDIIFSRLVAETAEQLPVFVGKQIDYETAPNTDASFYNSPVTALGWQTERWFQLCSEVFGGYMRNKGYNTNRINCIYDGTPGNSWSSNQNTSMVVSYFGPDGQNYIPASPAELGGWTGGTPDQVVTAVNNGTFWVQHRDHGLETGWGEPAVRNSHIEQLTNVGMLPFVMSINCETGMFDYTGDNGNCFAEKWMRRTSNGQNAGAVGLLCPTHVSYSFVNDAFVWGVYDLFDGDFMPDFGPFQPAGQQTGNWMPAFGNAAGKYFLAQSSWPYNIESKDITYQMFTAHCDAFLRIYTQVPQSMVVNHQNVQLAGLNTFQITAPEGATIALTKGEGANLEIVAVATATGSVQSIEMPSQVPPTVLHLTVTGQNYLRYEADIDVIPADGPYIIINEYALINEAPQLNFGEQSGFDIQLKNVGNTQAPAGTMTLTTESEYVTIINDNVAFGAINSNATEDLHEAFIFTVSDEVPNKTPIEFTVTITSGEDTYENHITMKAYAPVFEIGNVGIREINGNGNGRLDPGETVRLSFVVNNKGNADSHETNANLTINNIFMQIQGSAGQTISSIPANESVNFQYEIYVGNAPSGFAAGYTLDVASGVYTDSKDFVSKIGLNVEDFELGTLDPSMWTNQSGMPWTFCSDEHYEGAKCLKSGAIGHSAETEISLTYEVGETDSIAFYYKVSSETNYDKLYFYIDNVEKAFWSGSIAWTRAQYPVLAGTHTFKWKYKKDSSVSSGSDCAWIDFVILPRDLSMTASAGIDLSTCEDSPVQVLGYASNYQTIEWTTAGDGSFSDATIMDPIYTPGTLDIANGSVVLTMTVYGHGNTITDDLTVSIFQGVSITTLPSLLPLNYCAIAEPQAIAVEVEGDYTSFQWTTTGSGVFGNANELTTTYTPSAEDIEAGSVTLLAMATSEGCDPVEYEYAFDMNPVPSMSMPLPNQMISICQGENFTVDFATFEGYIDGWMTIDVNGETIALTEGLPLVLPTADLEPGNYHFSFHNLNNGYCESDPDMGLDIQVHQSVSITMPLSLLPLNYCAIEEPQTIAVEVEGDYTSFQWTTTGSGVFENANELTTTYTPSAEDIEAGSVTLLAMTTSEACGSVEYEYAFDMNPAPSMSMPLPNCILSICQGESFTVDFATFEGYIDGWMTIEINGETITLTEGLPIVLPTANLEPGNYHFSFHNLSNGYCETDPDMGLDIQVLETPNITVNENAFEICEGETVTFEIIATGGDPMEPTYTIEGEGFEPFSFTGTSYAWEMTPAEFTELRLTRVTALNTGCGDDCVADLDIPVMVVVIPNAAVPEINGDTELDVRLTPVSTYTIGNEVMVRYTLEPEEAGIITGEYEDAQTIDIEWSETFKGEALLTATPLSECNNGGSTMNIVVKNTTSVNEFACSARIYPNPTSEKVNIECAGMTHLTVFNAIGQMVYNAEVDTDKVVINTASMPAGSYLVRITTAEGNITKHLNVIQ